MRQLYPLTFALLAIMLLAFPSQAQILEGSTTLSGTNNMNLTVRVNTITNEVDLTVTGPTSVYYAVGFGSSGMNGTYAIIIEGNGSVTERDLGNRNAGTLLNPSLSNTNISSSGSVRTMTTTRPIQGPNNNYFTFPSTPGSFNVIWARGNGSNLSNHGGGNRGSTIISLSEVCNVPVTSLGDTTVCKGESVRVFGQDVSTAGLYFDTLRANDGCDSIISFEVLNEPINTSVQVFGGDSLVAQAINATYQWINCDSGAIAGAIDPSYVITETGFYAVEVTQNGCVDTSDCTLYSTSVGLNNALQDAFTVSPNPFNDFIKIESLKKFRKSELNLYDLKGRKVYSEEIMDLNNIEIPVSQLEKGSYILQIRNDEGIFRKVLIK